MLEIPMEPVTVSRRMCTIFELAAPHFTLNYMQSDYLYNSKYDIVDTHIEVEVP